MVGNGDILFDSGVVLTNALVVCHGNVQVKYIVEKSLIVAGGEILITDELKQASLKRGTILRPNEKKITEFLRFYDSAAEGMQVRAEGQSVFVERVDAGKPFARAGVQAGDRIVKVNGSAVRDTRTLNRLLCRAEVGYPGEAVLLLARGEKGVEVTVRLAQSE